MKDLIFVSSNLELATLLFSWHLYNQLWQLMLDTGLAFLPFLGMLINNFVQPITATYTTSAAQLSLKKVEWDFIQMLIIIVLAGQPFMELKIEKYRRLDLCQWDYEKNKPLEYEKVLEKSKNNIPSQAAFSPQQTKEPKFPPPKVPLWWYAVQSFSTGFTEAAKASVPCAQDARGMLSDMISGTMVENTSLTREIEDFIDKCYLPTKSFLKTDEEAGSIPLNKFNRSTFNSLKTQYNAVSTRFFYVDTEHIGSRTFRAMGKSDIQGNDHFYGATVKIPGWNGNPLITDTVSCRDWWGDDTSWLVYDLGKLSMNTNPNEVMDISYKELRQLGFRIFLTSVQSDAGRNLDLWLATDKGTYNYPVGFISLPLILQFNKNAFFKKSELFKPSVMRNLFEFLALQSQEYREGKIDYNIYQYVKDNVVENLQNLPQTKEPGFWKRSAAGIGLLMSSLGTYTTAYIARESFPHIQALLLMALCMFLSVGLVLSGYTLQFLYAGSIGIFTLKFMGFILYFCHWIDNNLIIFLSGKSAMSGESALTNLSEVVHAVYTDSGFSRLILDYSIAGIYFTFPSLFATMMVWAGVHGAEVISEAQKASNPLQQAAQQGAQQIQKIGTQLASAGGGTLTEGVKKLVK